jgi:hypothetical protein
MSVAITLLQRRGTKMCDAVRQYHGQPGCKVVAIDGD